MKIQVFMMLMDELSSECCMESLFNKMGAILYRSSTVFIFSLISGTVRQQIEDLQFAQ